jgi:putative chitinase
MTEDQLQAMGINAEWLQPLENTFQMFNIVHPHQQASFIGQCAHECNNFRTLQENLNYKAETLVKLWPKRFPSLSVAQSYAHQPEKIANKIYADRGGNRGEASGDGFRFHGRGCIQLTFHDNYWHCGQAIGEDLVSNPDIVATPQYAALSAGWFWATHGLNNLADRQDDEKITKLINGGLFGLNERVALTQHAYSVLTA